MLELHATTRLEPAADQVSCDLAGEAALLNLKTGIYYGLDPVGARVWQLLQPGITWSELCAGLEAEFEVERRQLEADVGELLTELAANGLLEVR